MRTTVRLPDELYTEVKVHAASSGETVTSFIEEALRAALARHATSELTEPYRVRPLTGGRGPQPGVDLDDSRALAELMADDAGA